MNTQESKRRKVCENSTEFNHQDGNTRMPFDVQSSPHVKFSILQLESNTVEFGSHITRFVSKVGVKLEYNGKEVRTSTNEGVVWIKLVPSNDKVQLTLIEDISVTNDGCERIVMTRTTNMSYIVTLLARERVQGFWYRMTVTLGSWIVCFKFQLCNIGENLHKRYPFYDLFSQDYQYWPLLLITFSFLDSKCLFQTICSVSSYFRRLVSEHIDLKWIPMLPMEGRVMFSETIRILQEFRIRRSEIKLTPRNGAPPLDRLSDVLSNSIKVLNVHLGGSSVEVGMRSLTKLCVLFPRMVSLSVYRCGRAGEFPKLESLPVPNLMCLKRLNLVDEDRTISIDILRNHNVRDLINIFETFPNLEYYFSPAILEKLESSSPDDLKVFKSILEKKMKLDKWGDIVQLGNPSLTSFGEFDGSRFLEGGLVFIYQGIVFHVGWSDRRRPPIYCVLLRTPIWNQSNAVKGSFQLARKKRRSGWKNNYDFASDTQRNQWLTEKDGGGIRPQGVFFDIFRGSREEFKHDYELYFRAKMKKFCTRIEGERVMKSESCLYPILEEKQVQRQIWNLRNLPFDRITTLEGKTRRLIYLKSGCRICGFDWNFRIIHRMDRDDFWIASLQLDQNSKSYLRTENMFLVVNMFMTVYDYQKNKTLEVQHRHTYTRSVQRNWFMNMRFEGKEDDMILIRSRKLWKKNVSVIMMVKVSVEIRKIRPLPPFMTPTFETPIIVIDEKKELKETFRKYHKIYSESSSDHQKRALFEGVKSDYFTCLGMPWLVNFGNDAGSVSDKGKSSLCRMWIRRKRGKGKHFLPDVLVRMKASVVVEYFNPKEEGVEAEKGDQEEGIMINPSGSPVQILKYSMPLSLFGMDQASLWSLVLRIKKQIVKMSITCEFSELIHRQHYINKVLGNIPKMMKEGKRSRIERKKFQLKFPRYRDYVFCLVPTTLNVCGIPILVQLFPFVNQKKDQKIMSQDKRKSSCCSIEFTFELFDHVVDKEVTIKFSEQKWEEGLTKRLEDSRVRFFVPHDVPKKSEEGEENLIWNLDIQVEIHEWKLMMKGENGDNNRLEDFGELILLPKK